MKRSRNVVLAGLAAATMLPALAGAAPCAGFSDLDDTSPFCPNVQWMRNRTITTGCTASTYCPGASVDRLSMAVFLRRLGNILTTTFQGGPTSGGPLTLASTPVVCTQPNSGINYPRVAHATATFWAVANAGPSDVAVEFVESTNNGTTWTPVSTTQQAVTVGPSDYRMLTLLMPARELLPSTTYRVALRVSRAAGSTTTADPSSWECNVIVGIDNRNPDTPPLDE